MKYNFHNFITHEMLTIFKYRLKYTDNCMASEMYNIKQFEKQI